MKSFADLFVFTEISLQASVSSCILLVMSYADMQRRVA